MWCGGFEHFGFALLASAYADDIQVDCALQMYVIVMSSNPARRIMSGLPPVYLANLIALLLHSIPVIRRNAPYDASFCASERFGVMANNW
mgnify:CR=1 FL=1